LSDAFSAGRSEIVIENATVAEDQTMRLRPPPLEIARASHD
jgi:hypothetical protein